MEENDFKVVKTDAGSKDGQNKCPKCGATDISTNTKTGKLRCNYCRSEFDPEKVEGLETDLKNLRGKVMGSGAKNIIASDDVMTFKCSSCGAEVVIDTTSSTQARCHWCRSILSINEQIPNGSIPDVLLPFTMTKKDAEEHIQNFVSKRKTYANPTFKREFNKENIMGVYFPYMLIDFNGHATLKGEGEHQTARYTVGSNENKRTYYDADLYRVERDFDIVIEGLSIESNSDRINRTKDKTNNIINSIMPFDVENCVKYNANYLRGYTSERRDVNIQNLDNIVKTQAKDITRFKANDTVTYYDRGVKWNSEDLNVIGEQWKSAYLPVWLYSYQEVKKDTKVLHYVAVNARTGETMGSIPIHTPKLLLVSFLVELVFLLIMLYPLKDFEFNWICLIAGFLYFLITKAKYRNGGARHNYEFETKATISNLKEVNDFEEHRKKLSNSTMNGANNHRLNGLNVSLQKNDEESKNE